ncbi:hypothetical protein [Peribacillus loiseleuriae]|uniref:Uncharacterized protein n=1 Tax=Peribacillus loiseleuriae TaxID=1679170 RepID=A0A0K9GVK9_9BACI|nr:hypothetical protein [Peribacillus loiseleuriae]KMY50292.1 hypothetical protein AC625_12940 [Peribacillus loiseleuriae]
MSENYEVSISNYESVINDVINKMEEVRIRFKKAAVPYVKEWMGHTARNEIKENPELAEKVGEKRLKELKSEVNALIENAASLIDVHLDNTTIWWHLNDQQDRSYYENNRIPDDIEKAIKYIFGQLGVVLSKDGFINLSSTSGQQKYKAWIESGNKYMDEKPIFPYAIIIPKEMKAIFIEYQTLIKSAQEKIKTIEALKKEQKQTEVAALWDSL